MASVARNKVQRGKPVARPAVSQAADAYEACAKLCDLHGATHLASLMRARAALVKATT